MPVMTKRQGDGYTDTGYAYDGPDEFDPYFPTGYVDANTSGLNSYRNNTQDDGIYARGQGTISVTFKQVEVD